jgi:ankyrin repeat protein
MMMATRALSTPNRFSNTSSHQMAYIKRIIEVGHLVDVPCFINNTTLQTVAFYENQTYTFAMALVERNLGMLQLLAPTSFFSPLNIIHTFNINSTPIMWAINYGCTDIVKILAPLLKKPNTAAMVLLEGVERTPIYVAADNHAMDILRFLAPLTDDPNESPINTWTPLHVATRWHFDDVIDFLAPLTDPSARNGTVRPPVYLARILGHHRIEAFFLSYEVD